MKANRFGLGEAMKRVSILGAAGRDFIDFMSYSDLVDRIQPYESQ
jgi:hypothetical protein